MVTGLILIEKKEKITDNSLVTFAADSLCELDVALHDCDSVCVDCAKVCVFEEADEVCFRCFLEGSDC